MAIYSIIETEKRWDIGSERLRMKFPSYSEIRISKTRGELKLLGLVPSKDEDGVDEMAWMDMAATSVQTLADSEAFATLGYEDRGTASTLDPSRTLDSVPPNAIPSESYFKAAGREIVTASYGGTTSVRRQIMNQADVFYFSGHGDHAAGGIQGGFTPTMARGMWNRDLNCVVIAGCAVLDVANFRLKSTGLFYRLKHRSWSGAVPGELWENAGPKYLLGYALKAPYDEDGGVDIATSFATDVRGGKSVVEAWRNANDRAKGRNACAIDCSRVPHVFWFWDESSGSPTWTSKTKGAVSW